MTGSDAVVGSPANAAAPGFQWSEDILTVATHGSTHWDGLGHAMMRGLAVQRVLGRQRDRAAGCGVLGIEQQRECFVGRGVLVDVARQQGVEACPARQRDHSGHARRRARGAGRRLQPAATCCSCAPATWRAGGRVPRVKTPMEYFLEVARASAGRQSAGCTNTASRRWPRDTIGGRAAEPGGLRGARVSAARGLPGRPGIDARRAVGSGRAGGGLRGQDGVYEFLLAAQPLHLPGGMGSPLNPIALK